MQIYLDYSATTPTHPQVIERVATILRHHWGNPSSLHTWGQDTATVIEMAREEVAGLINANPDQIIFTSGGTEADNLAIIGVAQQYNRPRHIIISSVEHSAIAEPCKQLEQQGWQITRLPVNRQGRVNPLDLKAAIQSDTVLISIIYGQSEVGTLQPIEELGSIARERGVLFHTDAVQVAARCDIDVRKLPVDLLSLSSHKIYGMQGSGALYIRAGVDILPLLRGGGQEKGLRSGTPAVPAIAAFGLAAELAQKDLISEKMRLIALRDRLFDLLADYPYLLPTGDRFYRLPHHVSFIVRPDDDSQITGKQLVRQLNLAGIGISSGSACHSGKLSPSPILKAMGYSDREALAGIRLTLGRDTSAADIDWTALVLKQVIDRCLSALIVSKS
ncbi:MULTISPECIES: cysteine desulfurase family protein [unclassified Microcystis]|uniref:cysteine desulfurase n=1 Tax=Microcystis flos-aquae Mf_QC_C_20070823_S10D TaxID=2486236 RepID=A0A552KP20_9CHRO|nr:MULTISPECIES: cysteine desulfurase family protein [unclassified Microcystis]MCA2819420.1 cysteine desulfurase [Microcystis sp. M085S1]MCA2857527.1 cysteine desulfurase [Microcystis sp. M065S1]TRT78108.1 MAG: cysteine desulfurase [Microcystis flos-aquae Ma_QC_C_20070823_S18]TRT98090.1 MAG: cysteine desulfurase [Microcystis flos-aquae Ma_QC_C_20070823_S18D]TRV09691.1 MAG: cysteine desulfurase [Microcystis flos-aquae Mf_QC_C_20070823_S10D]TRV21493.1 MAG: cysteine desulfurase [Microcystis flos